MELVVSFPASVPSPRTTASTAEGSAVDFPCFVRPRSTLSAVHELVRPDRLDPRRNSHTLVRLALLRDVVVFDLDPPGITNLPKRHRNDRALSYLRRKVSCALLTLGFCSKLIPSVTTIEPLPFSRSIRLAWRDRWANGRHDIVDVVPAALTIIPKDLQDLRNAG